MKSRILFASDIHASGVTFSKFLSAFRFYKADFLIFGGDITGKAVVPVFKDGSQLYKATFLNENFEVDETHLETLLSRIGNVGYYGYVTDKNDWEELMHNPQKIEKLAIDLQVSRLQSWLDLIQEKLPEMRNKGKIFIMPGNDDTYEIDNVLNNSEFVINPADKVLNLDGEHEMLGIGNANMTPWKCHRDISEEEMSRKIEGLASRITSMEKSIFLIHVPPYGTAIDVGPKLDENFRPVNSPMGGIVTIPVGSTAVRAAIEKYQPMLGLHGHIHESRGAVKIGRTLCINAGSEYSEGILRAVIIDISGEKVKDYIFISG
ncbi:MAG: metallophosphoesterase [Thermoplasmatales archaeon]